jgi:N-acetylmuramoyl-L-alanine amidase
VQPALSPPIILHRTLDTEASIPALAAQLCWKRRRPECSSPHGSPVGEIRGQGSTRPGDYDLETDDKDDVTERIKLIKSSGATIVISLHCNAFTDSSEWGAQTFYNSSKNKENKRLAELIQAQLKEKTGTTREASSRLEHFILNNSSVPSATIELGFLSNPHEEGLLGSPSYQQDLAEYIHQAILNFVAGSAGDG